MDAMGDVVAGGDLEFMNGGSVIFVTRREEGALSNIWGNRA